MARFDVFQNPGSGGYLLVVQSGLLDHLNTRVVVPLLPVEQAPLPARILNPVFEIDGERLVMVTQFMAAVPVAILRKPVTTLEHRHTDIVAAIDLLMQGF
ncbi:MAG: CcdB family protein [Gammaproteobacteria bacterium]|nr:CcdB family protein [Gammaproteobacteria bacterium]MBU1654883.1 CcdB family protein [Gammaproteobacteria bacterium]MBU1960574.1 CcdB family protein [Gammaproteobacteria bacterium]